MYNYVKKHHSLFQITWFYFVEIKKYLKFETFSVSYNILLSTKNILFNTDFLFTLNFVT